MHIPDTELNRARRAWRRGRTAIWAIGLAAWSSGPLIPTASGQGTPDYELAPIEYSTRTPSNRMSQAEGRLTAKRPKVTEGRFLRWLLEENGVSPDSQVLVFAKTSLQRDLIAPRQPRSLYFNDDLYIGWVPGGLMEVTVTDPELGMVFYKLESRDPEGPVKFERDGDCLACHGGSMTRNWPGLMVRSVFPDQRGEPITSAGGHLVGHDTPFENRWGGWYVTGRHGQGRHMGNALAKEAGREVELDREAGANLTRLDAFFDPTPYLRPDSDIVALMVFEHQVMMHGRLCEGGLRVKRWSHYQRQLQKEMGEEVTEQPVGTALRVVTSETERILETLLFCDEAALPEGGIQGAGAFEKSFAGRRKTDAAGRSLRDFDLRTRMFKYRCSYMIYSEAFDILPVHLKTRVLTRLDEILRAPEPPPRFAHLPAEERAAIRQILLATKPEFAAVAGGVAGR